MQRAEAAMSHEGSWRVIPDVPARYVLERSSQGQRKSVNEIKSPEPHAPTLSPGARGGILLNAALSRLEESIC